MSVFTPATLEAISFESQGCPRVINTLATTRLLYGCQMKREQIDEEIVRMTAEEHLY
jgi:general secretion pathway protein A